MNDRLFRRIQAALRAVIDKAVPLSRLVSLHDSKKLRDENGLIGLCARRMIGEGVDAQLVLFFPKNE